MKLKELMQRGIEILDWDVPMYIFGNDLVIVAWGDNAQGHGTATKGVNYWEGMRDAIWWLDK